MSRIFRRVSQMFDFRDDVAEGEFLTKQGGLLVGAAGGGGGLTFAQILAALAAIGVTIDDTTGTIDLFDPSNAYYRIRIWDPDGTTLRFEQGSDGTFVIYGGGFALTDPVTGNSVWWAYPNGNMGVADAWEIAVPGHEVLRHLAAAADGDVSDGERHQWYDDTAGAPKLRFKMRDSGGTLVAGVSASEAYVDSGLAGKAATAHAHSGADITSGTVEDARIDAAIARDSEVTAAVAAEASARDTAIGVETSARTTADWLLVPKSLYDANTVLAANSDDTPAALTMGASTILARLAAGNIKAATPAELRTLLALVVGTDVQAQDAELAALAGLTSAADKGIQFTGSGTAATFDLTTAGKALLDDASAAAQRTTLEAAALYDPMGWGFASNLPPYTSFSSGTWDTANRGYFWRLMNGKKGATGIQLVIATSSGNVSVSLYQNTGTGTSGRPGTVIFESGAIACPASGQRTISLGGTFDIPPGAWIGFTCDNTTANFTRQAAGVGLSEIFAGVSGYKATAHPLSGSSPALTANGLGLAIVLQVV